MPEVPGFTPKRGLGDEARIAHIERYLADLEARLTTLQSAGLPGIDGSEGVVPGGILLGGGGGGNEGTGVTPHEILNDAYHVDVEAATPASQDLLVRNASGLWARLAAGSEGFVLKIVSGLVAWADFAHNLLSSSHADTTAGAAARGALITGQGTTPTWARLLIGAAGRVLKSDGVDAAWGQVAHNELTGVGPNDHHNQVHSLTGSDHTVSGSEGQLYVVQTGGTSGALEDPSTHVIRAGTLASRPAATAVRAGTLYLATDDDGGTLYRSDGSNWSACGRGVTESAPPSGAAGGDLTGTYPNPTIASGAVTDAKVAAANKDGTAATPSMRTLGTGAQQAAAGNHTHAHSALTGIGPNDHHNQAHALFSAADHSDVTGTPASGDLIYRNASSQWARLPKGTDGQILRLSSGLPAWANANSVATSAAMIQTWRRTQISNAQTTPTEMAGIDGIKTGITMARSGTIVGVSVDVEGDITNTAGETYKVEVYKRTPSAPLPAYSATGVSATITTTANDNDVSAYETGSVTFSAGDQLTCYDQRSAGLSTNTKSVKATIFVVLDG